MLHLFTRLTDQGMNQSPAGAFLCTRMMGWNDDSDTRAAGSGHSLHCTAVQDCGGCDRVCCGHLDASAHLQCTGRAGSKTKMQKRKSEWRAAIAPLGAAHRA